MDSIAFVSALCVQLYMDTLGYGINIAKEYCQSYARQRRRVQLIKALLDEDDQLTFQFHRRQGIGLK